MSAAGNRGVLMAAIGAALLIAMNFVAMRPSKPLGADAPRNLFSAVRAFETLKQVLGDGAPHPMGSAANAKVRDVILARLSSLGYRVELQSGWVCNPGSGCGYPTNIIATLDRATDPTVTDAVLLAAHYDSVASGVGASDDGVGVATALEIARILAEPDALAARHPIVILLSDGEEGGLLGAMLFIRDHRLAKRIKAAVNMDARGTSGLSLMFETGPANDWLMHLYSHGIERPITNSFYYVIYKLLPNTTDFSVFKAAGYQGFNFAFIGNVGFYHTPLDNLSHVSLSTMQDQGRNAWQALAALRSADHLSPPVAEAVFFDVLGQVLVVWPAKSMVGVTVLLLVLSCGAIAVLVHRDRTRVNPIAWGLAGFLVNLLLGAALSAAAVMLLFALGKAPPFFAGPWLAHPAAMSIAAVAISLFAAGLLATWLEKRAGYWGLWCGGLLGLSACAVGIALLNPGAAFPWVIGVAAALIGGIPAVLTPPEKSISPKVLECAALLPGMVFLTVLLPLLLLLYQGLGAVAWPPISMVVCMACSFLLPLLALASHRLRRSLMGMGGGIAVGGLVVTLLLPTFSPQWPQRLNIEYWLDADTGQAHWWVQPAASHLPAEMEAVAQFDSAMHPQFPGAVQLGFSAPAPAIRPEIAHAEVTSTGHHHVELRLRPPRDTDKMVVVFPADARIQAATLATAAGPLTAPLLQLDGGATALTLFNTPAAGVTVAIDSPGPFSALVLDESYGLPSQLSPGKALQSARSENATSTQDGDVTVIGRTVR